MAFKRPAPCSYSKERMKRESIAEESMSEIPCLVIELPVWRVISIIKLAHNGEVLAGALPQKECDEGKIIPWEVVLTKD